MNKQDAQICSWLEESDLEETGAQCFDESMSESDRDSENLEHNSDTEQSGDEMMSSETCFHRLNLVDHRPSTSFNQLTTIPRSRSRSPVTSRRPSRSARQHRERLSFRSSSTSSNSSSDEPLAHIRVRPIRTFQTERNFIEPTTNRPPRVPVYKGKDGTKWLKSPPSRPFIRTRAENIVTNPPGVRGENAKNSKTPLDCFRLFITQQMLEGIVSFTNIRIRANQHKFLRERDTKETDILEIEALIGLLLMAGLKKMHHVNIHEMWNDDGTSPDILKATMSIKRFYFLMRNIRFDDIHTRTERVKLDNMAAMRDIFGIFCT
ncbi:unnamed protein product [Parnassius apollo]|uniref:(apollo) hypothetical protein n=1 Tax=Parnassius apollo TaxID=110799 RepID=A0A8S3XKR1_PARAO|nr:unnamed protein product [Parnassius apollo]